MQAIRENYRTDQFQQGSMKWEIFSRVYGRPIEAVSILTMAALACFTKALAYWAQFFGVGVTGPTNFWGSQLGWIFFAFFTSMALACYVCMRETWRPLMAYGFAAAAGAFFVGAFAGVANQLPFVLHGGAFALLLLIFVGLFRVRKGWMSILAIVLYGVVFTIGYALPYILSPNYVNAISILTTLWWYLITDVVVVLWFVFMVFTALECPEAVGELKESVVCMKPARTKFT